MIHMFQQVIIQSPDCDVFSADAVKAFYNLNRDLAMKKLKSECPEAFNLFMDKYNNSTNAFFHGLLRPLIYNIIIIIDNTRDNNMDDIESDSVDSHQPVVVDDSDDIDSNGTS